MVITCLLKKLRLTVDTRPFCQFDRNEQILNIESPFKSKDHSVNFVFREARKSCNHLLVIFTSVRSQMHWLDFDIDGGLLKANRANILWIHDDIGGQYTYYSSLNGISSVENSVFDLIEAVRNDLGISPENCTAAGMSKGGSAAILIGTRCNFANIVALVPQLAIGSYLLNRKRFEIIEHMAGGREETDITWLDSIVPTSLMRDQSNKRNVYIITSPYDVYFADYLPRVDMRLKRYTNFNLISTSSDLARTHVQTLHYNVPFMVSLLGLLSENLRPVIGETSNGSGLSGAGHRDQHPLQAKEFGGKLPNAIESHDCASSSKKLIQTLDALSHSEARLRAMRDSRIGRLQSYFWRMRRRILSRLR